MLGAGAAEGLGKGGANIRVGFSAGGGAIGLACAVARAGSASGFPSSSSSSLRDTAARLSTADESGGCGGVRASLPPGGPRGGEGPCEGRAGEGLALPAAVCAAAPGVLGQIGDLASWSAVHAGRLPFTINEGRRGLMGIEG